MRFGARFRSTFFACAVTLSGFGCNLHNPGDDPPDRLLYFPNTMTISPHAADEPPRYLFVGNSDFDLRYRSGSVQAYTLDDVAACAEECKTHSSCHIAGKQQTSCEIDDPSAFVAAEVRITPFVTSIGLSSDGAYLFAATRTAKTLTFMHVDSTADGQGVLRCPEDAENRCSLRANGGQEITGQDGQPEPWPADPETLLAGPLSDWMDAPGAAGDKQYVLVAHQRGDLSLFVFDPTFKDTDAAKLQRTSVVHGLTIGINQAVYDPVTKLIYLPYSTGGSIRALARVGIEVPDDRNGEPDFAHAVPYNAGFIQLDGTVDYSDTRDIAFIPGSPNAGGSVAASDRALIVAQAPSALLVADLSAADGLPEHARVLGTAVVGRGARRVVYGDFDGHPTAIVGSFDSRELAAIDLKSMQVRAIVPNLSGPFALVLDEPRKLLYAADFRSSVIRVVDLAPLFDPAATEAAVRVVLTLGKPRVLQELR